MQKMIHRRLNELSAAPCLETMRGIGDCHELHGVSKGLLAIDLIGKQRMVFRPAAPSSSYTENNCIAWAKIDDVIIVGVGDYHK